jgi:hypothetical protein
MRNKRLFLALMAFFAPFFNYAQENTVSMADNFRKEGKIYVVIGVILIIFAGLVAFLVYLDRRLTKLEKK